MLSPERFKQGLWRRIAPNFGILCLFLVLSGTLAEAMELVVWQPHKPGPRIILGVRNSETPEQAAERYEKNLQGNAELQELLQRQALPNLPKRNFSPLSNKDFQRRYLMITNMPKDLVAEDERVRAIIEPFAAEGAEAYLLPLAADLGLNEDESQLFVEMLDIEFMSLMAIGGDDVHRGARGDTENAAQENALSYYTNLVRDKFEIRLIQRKAMTIKSRLTGRMDRLLGICRGAQIIAFALGYELGKDIDLEINKGIKHGRGTGEGGGNKDGKVLHPEHPVRVLQTSSNLFYRIAGQVTEFVSNSYHHQWIIAQRRANVLIELALSAISPDGITEGMEFEDKVFLMQMHIELMRTRGEGKMKELGERMMRNTARWFVPGITCEGSTQ